MNIKLAALLTATLALGAQQQVINEKQAAIAEANEQIELANAYIEEHAGTETLAVPVRCYECRDKGGCDAKIPDPDEPGTIKCERFRFGQLICEEDGWIINPNNGWWKVCRTCGRAKNPKRGVHRCNRAPELAMAGMDNPPPSPGIGAVPCMTFLCGPHGVVHTFSIGAKPIWMTPAQWNDYWQDAYVNYLNEGGHAEAAEPIYSPDCS